MYQHGVTVKEQQTKLATPVSGTSGLQVILGTAPINLIDDPSSAVNKLIKVRDWDEAVSKLGYSEDFKDYTLCQSMYMNFKVFSNTPVIFVNVLDPETHKKSNTATDHDVSNKQAKVSVKGILLSSLVVKNGETTMIKGTDFTATFDEEGYVVLTFFGANQPNKVNVKSDSIDPSAVTVTDIIGSVDAQTGIEKGIELVRKVYPTYNLVPALLLSPGWSTNATVSAALDAKSEEINGCYRCMNIVDIDTSIATKYSTVESAKNSAGLTSNNTIVLWPMYNKDGLIFSYSAAFAAMIAYMDSNNADIPCKSPSNKELLADAVVLADGTEVNLDFIQANELNKIGVVTAIRRDGWRSWGNNTASYNDEAEVHDPKDRWIGIRRFFSWWGNRFILEVLDKVDENASLQLIESIVDAENITGNSYAASGYCAGAKITFSSKESDIINGSFVFEQELAAYTPLETVKNKLSFNTSMLQSALGGE